MYNWTALQGSSISGDLYKIATKLSSPNEASVVALDPTKKGGKVVHILTAFNFKASELLIDAINWLVPRPKARIAYDLSHHPRLGVDPWDSLTKYPGYYEIIRKNLVNRDYLFDKLYPLATGNFTLERLQRYDLLILVSPDYNYSDSDIQSIKDWMDSGGSLLILGESGALSSFENPVKQINKLLSNFSFQINMSTLKSNIIMANKWKDHPTFESCSNIQIETRGGINISGSAYPLWKYDGDILVAAQEYGPSRVILASDMNWMADNQISNSNNWEFAINIVNWLTSYESEVLLFVDEPTSPKHYLTPVAKALNYLEVSFFLTSDDEYLNLSLNSYSWKMVIIDNPWYIIVDSVLDSIVKHIKSGGYFICSYYQVDYSPTHELWSLLGFKFKRDLPSSQMPLYIWESSHSIFNAPFNYGANTFNSTYDYGDEGDVLSVYPNATALAGITPTYGPDNATIILRNDKKTLFNGYLIDQFQDDIDDSAYIDNFELWVNEISFMLNEPYPSPVKPPFIPGYHPLVLIFVLISLIGILSTIQIKKKIRLGKI